MMRGEPLVVLADALAEAIHTIGRVGPLGRSLPDGLTVGDAALAGAEGPEAGPELVARHGGRGDEGGRRAQRERQGAVADADYALESAVRQVAELAAQRSR